MLWPIVSLSAPQAVSKETLQAALNKYQGFETLAVDFTQRKILKDMDLTLKSAGHMSVRMPDTVIWEIKTPPAMKVELNKQQIVISSGSSQNKIQTDAIPERQRQEFLHVMNWLKMDADLLAADYTITQISERTFEFVSKLEQALFTSLRMSLNKNGHVENILFREVSGDEMHLHFSEPKVTYKKSPKKR